MHVRQYGEQVLHLWTVLVFPPPLEFSCTVKSYPRHQDISGRAWDLDISVLNNNLIEFKNCFLYIFFLHLDVAYTNFYGA